MLNVVCYNYFIEQGINCRIIQCLNRDFFDLQDIASVLISFFIMQLVIE